MGRARLGQVAQIATIIGALGAIGATAHTVYNLRKLRTPPAGADHITERVSVVIPARNEAANIGACVAAALGSTNLDDLEVIVLDDASTDRTAEVAADAAQGDHRFRLITSDEDVPAGWLGKTWACERLGREATGSVIAFLDADVVVDSSGIARSIALMESAGLDIACPYPRQESHTALERLVQPLLQWSWLTLLPLGLAETSPRPELTAGNGQLLIIDRMMYERIGGHGAVKAEVLEDIALVRAVKSAGGRGGVVDGTHVARCRMYDSADALVDGYTKSLWSAFGGLGGSIAVTALLNLMYVVPPLAAVITRNPTTRVWGLIGYGAGVSGRILSSSRTGGRPLPDSAAHPASIGIFSYLVAESWRRRRAGELSWRGRALP